VRLGEAVRRVVPQTDALLTIASVFLEQGDKAGATRALARAEQLVQAGDTVTARVKNRLRDVAAAVRRG